jgi:ThiS family
MTLNVTFCDETQRRTGCRSAEIAAQATVRDALRALDTRFKGLWGDLYSESKGRLRDGVTVSVNDTVARNLDQGVVDGDKIYIDWVPMGG